VVIGLLALQGVIGGVQWYLELPTELVWLHVAVAMTTWLAMLWTVATAGRLEPRSSPQATTPESRSRDGAPSAALTRG
jgi:heme A synthase